MQTQFKKTENDFKEKEKLLLEKLQKIDNEMKNQQSKAEKVKKNYEEKEKQKEIEYKNKLEEEKIRANEKYNDLLNKIKIQAENSKKIENENKKLYDEQLLKQKNEFLKKIQDTKDDMEKKIMEEKIKEKQEKEKQENEALQTFNKEKKELIEKQKRIFLEDLIKNKNKFCLEEISQIDKNNLRYLINELNISEQIPKSMLKKLAFNALSYSQNNKFNEIKHLNIIVIGPSGVGKSTLINAILELSGEEAAKTQSGKPCTKENKIYYSEDIKLRLIDTRGIEKNKYGAEKVMENAKNYINNCIKTGDPDKFVHCIWYCVTGSRLEDIEVECLNKLSESYNNNNLPIIVVYTKAINAEDYTSIGEEVEKLGKGFSYIYVISKAIRTNLGLMKQINLEELKRMSIEKATNAIESACFTSLKNNIIDNISNETKKNSDKIKLFINDEIEKISLFEKKATVNQMNELLIKMVCEIIKKYLNLNEENNLTENGILKIKNFINNFFLESKKIYIYCLEKIINEKVSIFSQELINLQNDVNSQFKGNLKIFNTKEDYLKILRNELLEQIKTKAEYFYLKNADKYIIEQIKFFFHLNYETASFLTLRSKEMNKIFELITKNEFNKLKKYI